MPGIHDFVQTDVNRQFISKRADPYVCYKDGRYYFTASVPEYDRIILRCSQTLDGLKDAPEKTVWKKHDSGIMSKHVWAPELHYVMGEWHIYFAASRADDIWALRPYVLRCTGDDPMEDGYEELGQMQADDEFSFQDFSLDLTVFTNQGKWYAVWAEKVSVGRKISNLYIAEMESPSKLKSEQVLLSTPCYAWERHGFWVNEGPAVLKHEDKLFLVYSASDTSAAYCMGMLEINSDQDVLDPSNWKKSRKPVFTSDSSNGLYGPGHCSFVKDEQGGDVMFYHARQYDEIVGDPLYDPNRHTMRMKIQWDVEGCPVFDIIRNY